MNVTYDGVSPGQQVEIWSRQALFGEDQPDRQFISVEHWPAPNFDPLPRLLERYGARGWPAEGLARLYFIEAISTKFEGSIERLDVGSTTSASVRIDAQFQVTTHDWELVHIEGLVPLANQ
jgi:hypothetical protein